MKIHITKAAPVLIQTHAFTHQVDSWKITGKAIAEEGECHCKDKSFDISVPLTNLSTSKEELIELVKVKLGI